MPLRLVTALAAVLLVAACGTTTPSTTPPAATVATPTSAPTAGPTAAPTDPGGSPAPTSVATAAAGAPPCDPADLKASHGLIEGAAGSVITTVVLVSAVRCSVDAFPALGLRDGSGRELVGAAAGGPGRIDLAAGAAHESIVRLANWCGEEPEFPLALEVLLAGASVPVTGSSFPEAGDLPPCNAEGPPILEGGAWTATS